MVDPDVGGGWLNAYDRPAMAAADVNPANPTRMPAPDGPRRTLELLWSLALADMRARYGRDRLNFLKWLIDPFALVGVYLVLVVFLIDRGGEAPGLSIACAVVPFHLLMMTVFSSMITVRERRAIVLNLGFRRELLPAASALTEAIAFSASLILLGVMMAIYGIAPTWAILWLPVVIAVMVLFTLSAAYPASIFGTWFPEWLNFARSLVRMMYFLAPGLIALDQITGDANDWVRLNPLTGIFESFRDALLYGQSPEAWQLLYPAGFAIVLLAIFVPLYRREQAHLAKVI